MMTNKDIDKLLDIGIALSSEKDSGKLFEMVLDTAMDITRCDAGTLYVLKEEALHFAIMLTKSLGFRKGTGGETVDLLPVPLSSPNVCCYAANAKKPINIANVDECGEYDFSGTKRYDEMSGYKTVSMLVVPMENDRGDIIGVLQLINALDSNGSVTPFTRDDERVVFSLASQAAICLTARNYAAEVLELLNSLVRVMATAIDARTPYNANHTRNMALYCERFIDYLNKTGQMEFGPERAQQLIMSIWLHDIGKLVIPLEVMDKKDSLTDEERRIMESHAEMTRKLLGEMSFPKDFRSVPGWAAAHHEKLDGNGYPDGLSGEDIPVETRILTIIDIFDALTARDRPYKAPMADEEAFEILRKMADENQIDGRLLQLFIDSRAWNGQNASSGQ